MVPLLVEAVLIFKVELAVMVNVVLLLTVSFDTSMVPVVPVTSCAMVISLVLALAGTAPPSQVPAVCHVPVAVVM